jgi:hypothetical protein
MQATRNKHLSPDHQTAMRALVAQDGNTDTARRFGISPQTVANLIAGLPVHHAIVESVARQLAAEIGGGNG